MSTLKKVKPNLLTVARKQMSKFINKVNLPNEINENEADLYHVAIIEAGFNQAKLEAEYKAKVQTYDVRSWLAVKDRLKQIGRTNVFILHDPTKPMTKSKDEGKGKKKDAGAGTGETPKEKRDKLIAKAKELGYTGALNVKNSLFEEFINNALKNGAGAGTGESTDVTDKEEE